jgi:hypothetical protein
MIESAFQRVASEIPYQGVTSIVRHLIAVEALVTKQRDDARASTLDLRHEPEKVREHSLYWGNALLTTKEAAYPPDDCERVAMHSTWLFAAGRALQIYVGLHDEDARSIGTAIAEAAWEARAEAYREAQSQQL